jgi:hypothetical protein
VGTGGSGVLKVPYNRGGHVWLNNNGKLKYSTDSAKTFITTNVYRCVAFALGKEAPGSDYQTIFIWGQASDASPEAMYRSIDKGITWIRANDDKHQWGLLANAGMIEADQNVYGRVYKSTAGMGIPWMGLSGYTNIKSINSKLNVSLFPMPFSNSVTLKTADASVRSVEIYNVQGVLVKSIKTDMHENESMEIGADLKAGIYFMKISDGFNIQTLKVIKKTKI